MHLYILAKVGSSMSVSGRFAEHMGRLVPIPFMTLEEPFYLYIAREVSLTSRIKDVIILSVYPSRDYFLFVPANIFFLKILGRNKLQ